jgi:cell division protein FtsW (lipid II flippase)
MLIILYEKLTYHFLYIAISIQTNVFTFIVYGIAVTIFLTFLCDGLVQLQLIPQVHYVNDTKSHNNNLHTIHKI